MGDAVTMVALPLTAVLVLDATPAELALIGAAQALPILLLSLPAGAAVDRRARHWPLLVGGDLVRAVLIASIPVAAVTGLLTLPLLALIAFAVAAAGTLFDVAFAGWVPRLVRGDALHMTNARVELGRSIALIGGPALGGALVAIASAPAALLADAASFVVSGVLVSATRRRETAAARPVNRQALRTELGAGVHFIRHQPLVRAVVLTAGINNLSRSIAMSIVVLYLVHTGQLNGAQIGLAFALGNCGFLVGAALSRGLTRRLGMGVTMLLGVGLFGPSMLVFALGPPVLAGPLFTLMVFAHGFGISIHNVNQLTIRQVLTPDELRARVAAVARLVIFGAVPIGTIVGGVVAERFGARSALVVGGLCLFGGSVPYLVARAWTWGTIDELPAGNERPEGTSEVQ